MNLQTTKPRARLLEGRDPSLKHIWKVSHPATKVAILTVGCPHDAADLLLRAYVLEQMIDPLDCRNLEIARRQRIAK